MTCRPERWLVGIPCLAAIWALAVWRLGPDIEAALERHLLSAENAELVERLEREGARVVVDGRDLSVTADAALPDSIRVDLDRLTAELPGLRGLSVRVQPPRVASPFRFEVARHGGSFILKGDVPPGRTRADLLDAARAGARNATVRDELRSATGAPDGFASAAGMLIQAAGHLDDVRARLIDREYALEGVAPDTGAYNAARSLLRDRPVGFERGDVAITPPIVSPYAWSMRREGDVLRLGGYVPSEAARATLVESARQAGLAAADGMQTARGLRDGIDFGSLAETALGALARLDGGRVSLSDAVLSVEGFGAARDVLPEVARDLRQWRHPGVEIGTIDLKAVPADPYRLSAARRDGRIVLAGYAPGEAERAELIDLAQKRFPFDKVLSRLRLADGAPSGTVPVARLALERLSTLAEGEAVLSGRSVRLAGRSPYPELAARMRRELPGAMPQGWAATADIRVAGGEKPLDARFCEDLLNDLARRDPIRFESGRDGLPKGAGKALAGLADVLQRCGSVKVKVIATVAAPEPADAARELAARRAAAVADSLRRPDTAAELSPAGQAVVAADPAKAAAAETIGFEVRP